MNPSRPSTLLSILACALLAPAALAQEEGKYPPPKPPELKWEDLLSGKLEDHWADMNCAIHSPTFALKADPDNPKGNLLALTRRPTGLIRSQKHYENFILECDWRHLTSAPTASGTKDTTGNSGLYVWADPLPTVGGNFTRAIEVQVCNLGNAKWYTSHGDLFPIWGATMTPDPRFGVSGSRSMPAEFRAKKTGEWNYIRITCVDGTIQQEMNGAVVSAGFRASPKKGYLCIESEGGPVEYRNMRIHELPGDPKLAKADMAVELPEGTKTTCLYNGVDLEGWKVAEGQKEEWTASDHVLRCAGKTKGEGLEMKLPLQADGGKTFTLHVDWKGPALTDLVDLGGYGKPTDELLAKISNPVKENDWNRTTLAYDSAKKSVTWSINGVAFHTSFYGAANDATIPTLRLRNPGHPVSFSNIILIQAPEKK